MKCHYCGASLGLAALAAGDSDFCSKAHRAKFQSRFGKGLALLAKDLLRPSNLAGPMTAFVGCDLPARHSPAREIRFPSRMLLPAPAFTIVPDPLEVPVTVERTLTVSPLLLPAATRDDRSSTLDRIARLGSRLGALRSELGRATGVRARAATA